MTFDDQLKAVITALSDSITRNNVEQHHEIVRKLTDMYQQNERMFLDAIESGTFKFEQLLEEVFDIPNQHNKHVMKYIANGLYEHFHKERIRKLEGFECCADKSSFITKMTFKALKTQQNLSLFADYQHVEQIKEDKDHQAYWSPTSVKDTDEAIQLFWDWYRLRNY